MKFIDKLFDTFNKRMWWIAIIMGGYYLFGLSQNYLIGDYLINLKDATMISFITQLEPLYNSFFGLLFLNLFNDTLTWFGMFYYAFGISRIICFVIVVLWLFTRFDQNGKPIKTFTVFGLLLLAVYVVVTGGIFSVAYSTDSALVATRYLNYTGYSLVIGSVILIIYTVFSIFNITHKIFRK